MAAVDGLLGEPESLWEGGERRGSDDHLAYGGRATRSRRHLLLPVLHAIQDRSGWVSRGGAAWPEPATYSMPRQAQPKLLRRIGAVDPESLESYRLHGGFTALGRAEVIGSDAVIREITESRLLGRGGAAFPTGRKWESV